MNEVCYLKGTPCTTCGSRGCFDFIENVGKDKERVACCACGNTMVVMK